MNKRNCARKNEDASLRSRAEILEASCVYLRYQSLTLRTSIVHAPMRVRVLFHVCYAFDRVCNHTNAHVQSHTHARANIYTYTHTHTHIYTHIHTHAHAGTRTRTKAHTHTHTPTHTHTQALTRAHRHTHTHTHAHTGARRQQRSKRRLPHVLHALLLWTPQCHSLSVNVSRGPIRKHK